MKVGLSLGAGGSRGWAHIGVLRALKEAGISIDIVNGSSIGSVVAGAYALYLDIDKMVAIAKEVVHGINVNYFNIFRYRSESPPFLRNWLADAISVLAATRSSILSHRNNLKALKLVFGENEFCDTQIPFSSVAVDLLSGKTVVINQGKLIDGILPSISIPGIFPPIERNGMLLIDGAVLAEVPVRELRQQGADFVIAVKLVDKPDTTYRNSLELLYYIETIKSQRLGEYQLDGADFQIGIEIPRFDSSRFDNYEIAIARGYKVARKALLALERRLGDGGR